jgi:hypothetical protein
MWTKRKLAMSQGEVIKERHPTIRLRFQKEKLFLGEKSRKC